MRVSSSLLCAALAVALAGCGGLFPDLDGGSGGSGGSGGGSGGSGGSGGGSGGSGGGSGGSGGGTGGGGGAGGTGGGGGSGGSGGCNPANPEPDVCGYGHYCDGANSQCGTVVYPPVCNNFASASAAQSWTPDAGTGPVIWTFAENTDDVSFCCESTYAFTATLYVYKPGSAWPSTLGAVPGFRYYNNAGVFSDATSLVRPSNYVPTGNNATFKTTLCGPSANAITAGFIFDNGNGFCAPFVSGTKGTAKLPDGGSC